MSKGPERELRRKGGGLKPTIHVGKDGVTEGLIEEVKLQIRKNKLVKIRLLPSAEGSRDEISSDIASKSSSRLVEIRGNTALLSDESFFEDSRRSHRPGD